MKYFVIWSVFLGNISAPADKPGTCCSRVKRLQNRVRGSNILRFIRSPLLDVSWEKFHFCLSTLKKEQCVRGWRIWRVEIGRKIEGKETPAQRICNAKAQSIPRNTKDETLEFCETLRATAITRERVARREKEGREKRGKIIRCRITRVRRRKDQREFKLPKQTTVKRGAKSWRNWGRMNFKAMKNGWPWLLNEEILWQTQSQNYRFVTCNYSSSRFRDYRSIETSWILKKNEIDDKRRLFVHEVRIIRSIWKHWRNHQTRSRDDSRIATNERRLCFS